MREINFLGLGFDLGQEQSGLKNSHEYFRQYFSFLKRHGLNFLDQGEVSHQTLLRPKIYSSKQVGSVDWQPYAKAYAKIRELLKKPQTLLNWGGDHSVAISTVGAFCAQNPDGYVLWVDAHADINLPDYSLSGNIHGMPLSILMNLQNIANKHFPWIERALDAEKLIYVGVRDLDPFEAEIVSKLNIRTYMADEVRRRGMPAISREIFNLVADRPLHVSFDIDSLSPEFAPSTGVLTPHGLNIEDLKILGDALSKHRKITSIDIVEINPALGSASDVFQTYMAALVLLVSIFYQGETYDGIGQSVQTIDTAQMESRS